MNIYSKARHDLQIYYKYELRPRSREIRKVWCDSVPPERCEHLQGAAALRRELEPIWGRKKSRDSVLDCLMIVDR